jgi:hypothetical protein
MENQALPTKRTLISHMHKLLLEEGEYEADNVYNQDESGAFWRQMPMRSLATGKRAGHKMEKERMAFSLCTNASGSHKMELFVIGKAALPCSCPKSVLPKRDLDLRYAHNKTAWMTAAELSRWIKGVNFEMKWCVLLGCCCADKCAHIAMPGFSASLQIRRPRTCLV